MSLSPKTLQSFSFDNPPCFPLPRSREIQNCYDKHMANSDACQNFKKDIKIILSSNKYHIQKNDFPYLVEEGVEHLLFWTTDISNALVIIPTMFDSKLITFWKNRPSNCSIPEIDHIHVFTRT